MIRARFPLTGPHTPGFVRKDGPFFYSHSFQLTRKATPCRTNARTPRQTSPTQRRDLASRRNAFPSRSTLRFLFYGALGSDPLAFPRLSFPTLPYRSDSGLLDKKRRALYSALGV